MEILQGQMTYNANDKTWVYTPPNKLTKDICCSFNKIQSRKGYYMAMGMGLRNTSRSLEKMILWVEERCHRLHVPTQRLK